MFNIVKKMFSKKEKTPLEITVGETDQTTGLTPILFNGREETQSGSTVKALVFKKEDLDRLDGL